MTFLETRIPPGILVIVFGFLMWLVAQWLPGLDTSAGFRVTSLMVMALVGLGFVLAGAWSFRRARTTVNPVRPEASSRLVVSGIYRFTRNPMYVGFLCLLIGWGLWLSSGYALVLPVLFVVYLNRFQIRPEERALSNLFGNAYVEYCRRVRRWV